MSINFKVISNEKDLIRMNVEGEEVEFQGLVAKSQKMLEVIAWTVLYARTADVICLCGESGTGKEMIFRVIKQLVQKTNGICVNCGAMTDSLLESELFGHRKGSFTDAISDRKGAFLEAGDGLLFLDEIGEMSLKGQSKLLRAIEYKEIKPLGSDISLSHRAKLVLATNRVLPDLVKEGKFRSDLFFRIEGFTINIPPLRERPEDIDFLIRFFSGPNYKFTQSALDGLMTHSWPGNVRELKNAIERAKVKSIYGDKPINWEMLGVNSRVALNEDVSTLEEMEKILIQEAYMRNDYNISHTSKALGIPRSTLYSKLRKYDLIS